MKMRLIAIIAICLGLCACHKTPADNESSENTGSQTAAIRNIGENALADGASGEGAPSPETAKNGEIAEAAAKPVHPCDVWFKDAPRSLDEAAIDEADRLLQTLESGSCDDFGLLSQKYGAAAFSDSKLPFNGDMKLLCRYLDLRLNRELVCMNDLGAAQNDIIHSHGECASWCSDQWFVDNAFNVDVDDAEALCRLAGNHLMHSPQTDALGNVYRVRYQPGFGDNKTFGCSQALDKTWDAQAAWMLYRRAMQIAPLRTAYYWITRNLPSFEPDEARMQSMIAPLAKLAEEPENSRANLALAGLYAGGFGVARDAKKSAAYLEKAFKSPNAGLLCTELGAIIESLNRPARDARYLETDDKSRREARNAFLLQIKSVLEAQDKTDVCSLVLGIAMIDASVDVSVHAGMARMIENLSNERFAAELKCVAEPGTSKPPESCGDAMINALRGRAMWKRIEAMLLDKIPADSKSVLHALAEALKHNPGGYFAAEFAADVLTDPRFDEDAKKLAYGVIQRDPTGTAAMTVVKISWLYPGLLDLPKPADDYFKLAADKSLNAQYGSYALEYGLYLLGMPLHQPIAQKTDLRYALKPALYNSYNGSRPLCVGLVDPWCYLYSMNDYRPVRHAGWNKLWTVYRQLGDIDWQFTLNCLESAEAEFGSDSCDSVEPYVPEVCLQHAVMIETPNIDAGKRYIKKAIDLSQSDKLQQFFDALHLSQPVQSPQTIATAGVWQQTLFTRLAFETFLSELGYGLMMADDEDSAPFMARMQKAAGALRSITK